MAPLPTRQEALRFLKSFPRYKEHGDYAGRHLDRILRTLGLLPPSSEGRAVLELGSAPFFMSLLAEHYLGFEVTPANFFGHFGDPATERLWKPGGVKSMGSSGPSARRSSI